MNDTELMQRVHQLEFDESNKDEIIRDIIGFDKLPKWLTTVFEAMAEGKRLVFEFQSDDGGFGESILEKARRLLHWPYFDDGEYAVLIFPRLGYGMIVSYEAISSDGRGCNRVELKRIM